MNFHYRQNSILITKSQNRYRAYDGELVRDYLGSLFALFATKRHRVMSFGSAAPFREAPEAVIANAVDHGKGRVRENRSGGMEDLAGGDTL